MGAIALPRATRFVHPCLILRPLAGRDVYVIRKRRVSIPMLLPRAFVVVGCLFQRVRVEPERPIDYK